MQSTAAYDSTAFFKALADETRLTIVRLLCMTDLTASEINHQLGAAQNMVSYHLRQLRSAGLVRDRRSSQDARDVYYSLDLGALRQGYLAAGDFLHPGLLSTTKRGSPDGRRMRVLFLCTHNAARSQVAEGLMRQLSDGRVDAFSAGTLPTELHPLARTLLEVQGMDASAQHAKHVEEFAGLSFDYVITVCDRARERCPSFPQAGRQIHWSLPDPLDLEGPAEQMQALRATASELAERIGYLMTFMRAQGEPT